MVCITDDKYILISVIVNRFGQESTDKTLPGTSLRISEPFVSYNKRGHLPGGPCMRDMRWVRPFKNDAPWDLSSLMDLGVLNSDRSSWHGFSLSIATIACGIFGGAGIIADWGFQCNNSWDNGT